MPYYASRHEGGAVAMADGYARVTGRVGVCSVTQGPGVTNTLTALTEARKAGTPMLLLAGDTAAWICPAQPRCRSDSDIQIGRRDRRRECARRTR